MSLPLNSFAFCPLVTHNGHPATVSPISVTQTRTYELASVSLSVSDHLIPSDARADRAAR